MFYLELSRAELVASDIAIVSVLLFGIFLIYRNYDVQRFRTAAHLVFGSFFANEILPHSLIMLLSFKKLRIEDYLDQNKMDIIGEANVDRFYQVFELLKKM